MLPAGLMGPLPISRKPSLVGDMFFFAQSPRPTNIVLTGAAEDNYQMVERPPILKVWGLPRAVVVYNALRGRVRFEAIDIHLF
jgi:hypothetical protein